MTFIEMTMAVALGVFVGMVVYKIVLSIFYFIYEIWENWDVS